MGLAGRSDELAAARGPASEEAVKLSCHGASFRRGPDSSRLGRVGRRVKPLAPRLARCSSLRRPKKVLQGHVNERAFGVGKELVAVPELARDLKPAAASLGKHGRDQERVVDVDRLEEADREPGRDRREPVPRREQAARLVERRPDETAVDEARRGLVMLMEREGRFVVRGSFLARDRQVDPRRVVTATPAGRVMMWRDSLQRRPPRSKCALKKFSEPDVAIAEEAEISRASVAAATIWAKR